VTTGTTSLDWWMAHAIQAADEVARMVLGADGAPVVESGLGIPASMEGACVALVGEECSIQVGLVSDTEGCRKLAEIMLGMPPEGDDMTVDAICELANMLSGIVKRSATATTGGLQSGLPMYLRGTLLTNGEAEVGVTRVNVGDVPCHLLVLRSQEAFQTVPPRGSL
jgi:hypothetical protein